MKKYILFGLIVVLIAWLPVFMAAWDNTLPADNTPWNQAAGNIRDNWDAIEGGLSPVVTVYNVQDAVYGADGSDSSDDATAVQAAIDAAEAAGGGTIYFPPGTYELDSDVVLDGSNITLLGVPGATIINIDRAAEDTVNLQNNYGFYISGAASQDCVVIDGLEFTGTGYWGCIYSNAISTTTGWDETGTLHTFDASTAVDITTETITVNAHGMTQGQAVKYSDGGGTALGNIADDGIVFVINAETNTFQLARSEAGEAIDITSKPASESHTVRELAEPSVYTSYRANFVIRNCKATDVYFEFANLSQVQCHIDNIKLSNVDNDNDIGAIRMRYAEHVAVTNVELDDWTNKAINTSYCDGVGYDNITLRAPSANTDMGLYSGHFNRNVHINNCNVTAGYGFKFSYNCRDTHLSNSVFRCSHNSIMQGCRRITINNCTFHNTTSSGAASQCVIICNNHTDYGDIKPSDIIISNCYISSDNDGTTENRELDLSEAADTLVTSCTIRGRIYARPARNGLCISGNDIYNQNETAAQSALYFRRFEGIYIIHNVIRNHPDINATATIYLHGDSYDNMDAVITGNAISKNETNDFAVYTRYATTSTIRAWNNSSIKDENSSAFYETLNTDLTDERYMPRGDLVVALANDATPSVCGGNMWLTGGTTTITDFDDGYAGQIITVIAEHSLDITDGTNIFLSGSANWSMTATDTLTLIQKADGKWYEIGRSDSGA